MSNLERGRVSEGTDHYLAEVFEAGVCEVVNNGEFRNFGCRGNRKRRGAGDRYRGQERKKADTTMMILIPFVVFVREFIASGVLVVMRFTRRKFFLSLGC